MSEPSEFILRDGGPPSVRRLEVRSVVDSLYSDLRRRILLGDIAGESILTEVVLATEYGVARPTAKAAIERLLHEGLLEREPNRTARVPRMTPRVINDLYVSRLLMERGAIRELAQRRQVPQEALAYQSRFQEYSVGGTSDIAAVVECDIGFHMALVDALQLNRFSAHYRMLMSEVQLAMMQVQRRGLGIPSAQATDHATILEAILEGNVKAADIAIVNHIDAAVTRLSQMLIVARN